MVVVYTVCCIILLSYVCQDVQQCGDHLPFDQQLDWNKGKFCKNQEPFVMDILFQRIKILQRYEPLIVHMDLKGFIACTHKYVNEFPMILMG